MIANLLSGYIVLKVTTEQRGRINQAFIISYSFISWKATSEVSFLLFITVRKGGDHMMLWNEAGWWKVFVLFVCDIFCPFVFSLEEKLFKCGGYIFYFLLDYWYFCKELFGESDLPKQFKRYTVF